MMFHYSGANADQAESDKAAAESIVDVTVQWQYYEIPAYGLLMDSGQDFLDQGHPYHVDGHDVLYAYSKHEKHIGEVIAELYHKRVWLLPRVNNPEDISLPDYFIGEYGIKYDLKTIKKIHTRYE